MSVDDGCGLTFQDTWSTASVLEKTRALYIRANLSDRPA